jgi:prepilin-type N-terminal cleavage/methylation domain-containing protein
MASPFQPHADDGFTLVEALVALFLLASVALGLADLTARAVNITGRAREQALMIALAQQRVEQLVGLGWGLGDGVSTMPVADTGTDLSRANATTGGFGLAVSPVNALAVDTAGYSDFADRRGNWLGSGPAMPPGAAFVRRWRVSRVPSTTACLAVEVLVDAVRGGSRAPTAAAVTLATVKTRKAA